LAIPRDRGRDETQDSNRTGRYISDKPAGDQVGVLTFTVYRSSTFFQKLEEEKLFNKFL